MVKPVDPCWHLIKNTVGVQPCRGCHADIHPSDPHQKIDENTYQKELQKENVYHVCHPKLMGPKSRDVIDYRTEEVLVVNLVMVLESIT